MKKVIAFPVVMVLFILFFHASYAQGKDYIIGHMTTCSGLIDNGYPADSVNWFYRGQHQAVQYWAYILFPLESSGISMGYKPHDFINPFGFYSGKGELSDTSNFVFECRWVAPEGKIISETVRSWSKSDSSSVVMAGGRRFVPHVFANHIGIQRMFREFGQQSLPAEEGLYHIELYINGKLASVTFFEMKD
ncbi:MAG TPA: hypothetical protein ENN43_00970 [bacterium]|nr:hypothetical protein [bacterium]